MKKKLLSLLLVLALCLGMIGTVSAAGELITSGDWTYRLEEGKARLWSYNGTDTEVIVPATIDGYQVGYVGSGMGSGTFSDVKNTMTAVYLEEGVAGISTAAFQECIALEYAYIPSSVKYIGSYAFFGCSSLNDVYLEEGLEQINSYAFASTDLLMVLIPESVTYIGDYAFGYTGEWGNVKEQVKEFAIFGYSGTAAQKYAKQWHFTFYRLDGMEDYSGRCGDLSTWRFEESTGTLYFESEGKIDGGCGTDAYNNGVQPWIVFAEDIKRVVVGEGITHLGDFSLAYNYPNLTEVVLPESLRGIGNYCFKDCTGLTQIDLPEKTAFIGGHAFAGTSLNRIVLHGGGKYSSNLAWAFDDCAKLKTIIFTGDPWTITENAFQGLILTAYYPAANISWTENDMQQYGGNVTWKPYTPLAFTDVYPGTYCFDSVGWAVEKEITKGMTDTTFAPDGECTRGQVVTFLWRAAGSPDPTVTEHPFTDVSEGAYYYQAMLWAVENGVTSGMTADTFAPNAPCSRGQVVTFLHRAKDKPAAESAEHPFTDVSEGGFYYNAMLWAVENGITSGMSANTFAPDNICTRGQVVTFLYRAFAG